MLKCSQRFPSDRSLVSVLLLCFLAGNIAIISNAKPESNDFLAFYAAGTIVRSRERTHLYRPETLTAIERHVIGYRTWLPIPYEHPPFEALLFVPLSYLPIREAFIIWGLLSTLVLALACRALFPNVRSSRFCLFPMLLCFASFPTAATIMQGQDSALLFLALTAAFVSIERGADGWAGVFLGLSIFKFQYAIPMTIIFALQRRWTLVGAFASTGIVLSILSLAIVGARGLSEYWQHMRSYAQETTWRMPNLRGIVDAVFNTNLKTSAAIVLAGSVLLIVWAGWRRANSAIDFSTALIVALLVSYHLHVYDLVVLLLPTLYLLNRQSEGLHFRRSETIVLCIGGMLLLSPLTLLLLSYHLTYLLFWPILIFANGISKETRASFCDGPPSGSYS